MGLAEYGHSNALPGTLAHIHGRRDAMLRPGASYTIFPAGDILINPQHVGRLRAPRGDACADAMAGPGSHLPLGLTPVRDHCGRGVPAGYEPLEAVRPCRRAVPHGEPGEGADAFVGRIIAVVASHDNAVCAGALSCLPRHRGEFARGPRSTIYDLCAFVRRVVAPDMPGSKGPDTVFVGMGLLEKMGEDWMVYAAARLSHIIGIDPMIVLAREGIPDDAAYVTSGAHGPVFVDGPTTITCADDALVVERSCAVAVPRGRGPARGFCVGVRGA